jgi:hypothetical protein
MEFPSEFSKPPLPCPDPAFSGKTTRNRQTKDEQRGERELPFKLIHFSV